MFQLLSVGRHQQRERKLVGLRSGKRLKRCAVRGLGCEGFGCPWGYQRYRPAGLRKRPCTDPAVAAVVAAATEHHYGCWARKLGLHFVCDSVASTFHQLGKRGPVSGNGLLKLRHIRHIQNRPMPEARILLDIFADHMWVPFQLLTNVTCA